MQKKSLPYEKAKTIEDVCIVGAGIAGLSSLALMMSVESELKNVKNIHVIEKRDFNFKRRQKIASYDELSEQIGADWFEFCQNLFDPMRKYSLDENDNLQGPDITKTTVLNQQQSFLQKMLRQKKDPNATSMNFSIKELQLALMEYIKDKEKESKINIHWHDESTIQNIDLKNKRLEIKKNKPKEKVVPEQETKEKDVSELKGTKESELKETKEKETPKNINFDLLILSSGTKREGINAVNDAVKKQHINTKPFQVLPFDNQPPRLNCAVRIKLKPLNQIEGGKYASYREIPPTETAFTNLKGLRDLGWEGGFKFPDFSMDENWYKSMRKDWKPRIFIASAIPEALFNITDINERRAKITEWAILMASSKLKLPKEYFEFDPTGEDQHHQLNATMFTSEMHYIDQPVMDLAEENCYVVVIGDEAMSALYQAGSSSTIALLEAHAVVSCMLSEKANFDERFESLKEVYFESKNNMAVTLSKEYPTTFLTTSSIYKAKVNKEEYESNILEEGHDGKRQIRKQE